jgi:hypothetical protein
MNNRERWIRTMHFQPVDHVVDEEFSYWDQTPVVWRQQGMPDEIGRDIDLETYFGFSKDAVVPTDFSIMPCFEARVLEETDRHRISIDSNGVKSISSMDGSASIPKYLEFPVRDWDSWNDYKSRLRLDDPERFYSDAQWAEFHKTWDNRDHRLGIYCGSMFGWVRDWMGFENVSIACIEQPDLIEDMIEHSCNLSMKLIERPAKEFQLDYAHFWEDICFNKGPIISPKMFNEWVIPRYKRITDFLKGYGVDVVSLDCDGNINQLAPLWLEAGVNVMFPLEIRGGTDPYELRARFGRSVLLKGGVDKTKIIEGKSAIRKEINRLEKLVADGGFVPHMDHLCPPDVTFENYNYYLKTKREAFGIPEPAPWDERKKALGQ